MKEKMPLTHPDRLKWFRNAQLIGAAALASVAIYMPTTVASLLNIAAVTNVAQAGASEAVRQRKLGKHRPKYSI